MFKIKMCRFGLLLFFACACILCFVCCSENKVGQIDWISAEDVVAVYDGDPHGITVDGLKTGDTVMYATEKSGEYTDFAPGFVIPGTYTVYYKVSRSGYADHIDSATVTVRKGVLSGVSAADKTVIYSGEAYNIDIIGTAEGDEIEITLDGEPFAGATETGIYTVYYYVDRGYEDYYGSCVLAVIPDTRGIYINERLGTVEIDSENITDYEVEGGILSLNGEQYKIIGEGQIAHVLKVNGSAVAYFAGKSGDSLTVDHSSGEIRAESGAKLFDTGEYNYTESANCAMTRDYIAQRDTLTVGDGSELCVELSVREQSEADDSSVIAVYDGEFHGFGLSGNVLYRVNGEYTTAEPKYTELGEYAVTAVVLEDEKLPKVIEAKLTVAPDCSGEYYSDNAIVIIDKEHATVNGVDATFEYKGEWSLNGETVLIARSGLTVGEKEFHKVESEQKIVYICCADNTVVASVTFQVFIIYSAGEITVTVDDAELLKCECETDIEVSIDGEIFDVIDGLFIIGISELSAGKITYISVK